MYNLTSMSTESNLLLNGPEGEELNHLAQEVVEVARKIAPRVCQLKENEDSRGFMVGITKNRQGFPTLTVQIGTIENEGGKQLEFIELKGRVLKDHPGLICSRENLTLPDNEKLKSSKGEEITGGAVLVRGDIVIITSGFKNAQMDTAVSLAMATGAGLTRLMNAESRSEDSRLNCRKEFMRIEDILIEEVLH